MLKALDKPILDKIRKEFETLLGEEIDPKSHYNPTIVIERDSAVGGWEITIDNVQVFFRDSVVAENFGAMLEHSEHILSLKEKKLPELPEWKQTTRPSIRRQERQEC